MTRSFTLRARRLGAAIDFSGELNPEQYAVATAPGGPMLVVAGAGSGKTRALTYRLAWLAGQGVPPARIMLATFTNRAAREMLHRVQMLIQHETNSVWGGTFHHLANRLLRLHAQRIGISPEFTILDREDARDVMGTCIAELGIKTTERRFPHTRVLCAISSFVQNTLEPLGETVRRRYPMFMNVLDDITAVLRRYAERKRALQLMDYDDLLTSWLGLLREHDDLRAMLAEEFLHILVDEYQDTNAIQGEIIDLMASAHRNVCVVGDDAQAIYSFRGADVRNILSFKQRYPDAREFRLETNYRSTPEILALANASIACNLHRLPKELRAVRPSGLKPAYVTCRDHYVQARFVAEYILHLLDENRNLNDIAVLYRSHWHALELELELRARNIPYHVRGGIRFFEQAHIKDTVAFLRLLHNPRDELSWRRCLLLLPRIGPQQARRVWQHIGGADDPLHEACAPETAALLTPAARPFYQRFADLITALRALPAPAEMIDAVLNSFYGDYIDTHYDGAPLRKEDIRGLANFATQYQTLEAFLSDVSLAGDMEGETCKTGPEEQEFVVLSTVHQAKGLEWPVVIIPWLADGRFPTDLAINTPEEEEEERRVFHVATTRAKDELYLVVPQCYYSRGVQTLMKPSRFLMEIPRTLYEPMELHEDLPEVTVGRRCNGGRGGFGF